MKITGEEFIYDNGTSFTLYSKNILLVYGGILTLNQPANQCSKIMSLLAIKKTEGLICLLFLRLRLETLELECKTIAFEKLMGRAYHSANLFDTKVVLFGGQDSTKNVTNRLSFIDLGSYFLIIKIEVLIASLKVGEFKKAEKVPGCISYIIVINQNQNPVIVIEALHIKINFI